MARKYTELTFTDGVKETQAHFGARDSAAQVEGWDVDDQHLSPTEIQFIEERDGFFMATVGESGWPYVQFRGGPAGFLKVVDSGTLRFADFRGNRQYISTGNLRSNDRVALILMDFAERRRLKVMATAEVVDADAEPELLATAVDNDYRAHPERVVTLHVVAFDWNCPQHITPRYSAAEWNARDAGPTPGESG